MVNQHINKYPKESITVLEHSYSPRYRRLYSKSEFFDTGEYFVIEQDEDCLIIKKCYMEIPTSAMRINKHSSSIACVSQLAFGTYTFDEEETNEDQLVIYLDETKIEIET